MRYNCTRTSFEVRACTALLPHVRKKNSFHKLIRGIRIFMRKFFVVQYYSQKNSDIDLFLNYSISWTYIIFAKLKLYVCDCSIGQYWFELEQKLIKYSRTSIIWISIIRTLSYPNTILKLKSFDFQQNQVIINGMLVWFLDLLGLLYYSTVDRKAYKHV